MHPDPKQLGARYVPDACERERELIGDQIKYVRALILNSPWLDIPYMRVRHAVNNLISSEVIRWAFEECEREDRLQPSGKNRWTRQRSMDDV